MRRATYFQFPIHSARRTWFTQYQTSDVAENLGRYFLYEAYIPGNDDFELILTVTRRVAVYVETHCNISSKTTFTTSLLYAVRVALNGTEPGQLFFKLILE